MESITNMNGVCHASSSKSMLCMLVTDDNTIHINALLHMIENGIDPANLSMFSTCQKESCGQKALNRLFGYLKIYRDVPAIRQLINHERFPVDLFENYILFLTRFEIMNDGDPSQVLDRYLSFVSSNKIIELFEKGRILPDDNDFFFSAIKRLDNKNIDSLLDRLPALRDILGDCFARVPEESLKDIFIENPLLYHYSILFMELKGDFENVKKLEQKFGHLLDSLNLAGDIIRIIESGCFEITGDCSDRGRKISLLASIILNTKDPESTLALVLRSHTLSEMEVRILSTIVKAPDVRNSIQYKPGNISLHEVLAWADV